MSLWALWKLINLSTLVSWRSSQVSFGHLSCSIIIHIEGFRWHSISILIFQSFTLNALYQLFMIALCSWIRILFWWETIGVSLITSFLKIFFIILRRIKFLLLLWLYWNRIPQWFCSLKKEVWLICWDYIKGLIKCKTITILVRSIVNWSLILWIKVVVSKSYFSWRALLI